MVLSVAPSVVDCLLSEENAFQKAVSVAPWKARGADVNNNKNFMSTFKMASSFTTEPLYATTVRRSNNKKCVNFAKNEDIIQCLELKYGGKDLANNSAVVIQRAFRAYRLQRQFSKLLTLALSSDRLDRRMSLLGPDVEMNVDTGLLITAPPPKLQSPVEKAEAEIDKLILEAAGIIQQSKSQSPSQRHINNRKINNKMRRSVSMKCSQREFNTLSSVILNRAQESRDDTDLPSPVQPCPPLKGEQHYNVDPIYVTRDSLYVHQQQNCRVNLPPRPPQRTVSFLNQSGTFPRKMSQVKNTANPIMQHQANNRFNSDSDLNDISNGSSSYYQICFNNDNHNRSLSTPAQFLNNNLTITTRETDTPLPPPPYISPPPHPKSVSPLPPPPPSDMNDNLAMIQIENLPPPPDKLPSPLYVPPVASGIPPQIQGQVLRPPCDSASSSSSLDSGYGRSSISDSLVTHQNNNRTFNNNVNRNGWVQSPPPPTRSPASEVVFEPRPPAVVSHNEHAYGYISQQPPRNVVTQPMEDTFKCQAQNQANAISETTFDIYGKINKPSQSAAPVNYMCSTLPANKTKKTVRIQTPETVQQIQNEKSNLVEDDVFRRRQYRVGLNLFNQNPELGMEYLLKKNFLDYSPAATAKFLYGRKGLSKIMIGEYLCNLQRPFNQAALHCFMHETDFSGLHLDIALRQLQQEVTMPKEAQKIEKIVEVFSKRYIQCNQMFVAGFRSPDTIFVLSYAIVLLNTDLHSRAVKSNRRMRKEDFVRNLKGVDAGADLDQEMLEGIYDRIKASEFKAGSDHVSQVTKVEETISGRSKNAKSFAETHRRLVCFCRLTEIVDIHKKEKRSNAHQRGVFLFNDLLVVTKSVASKKKTTHLFRSALNLAEIRINVFSTDIYEFGIQLQDRLTGKEVGAFNARSASDRQRFVHDLEEAVAETTEMHKAKMFMNQKEGEVEGQESYC